MEQNIIKIHCHVCHTDDIMNQNGTGAGHACGGNVTPCSLSCEQGKTNFCPNCGYKLT